MTIATTSNKTTQLGNGSTTVWPYTFLIPDADYVSVYITDDEGNITTLTDSQYNITGIDDPDGGTVVYPLAGSPLDTGSTITIVREVPYTQLADITNQGGFFPEVVEGMSDYSMMAIQQLAEQQGRALQFPVVDIDPNPELPAAAARAGLYLAFDNEGNPIAAVGAAGVPVSAFMATLLDDTSSTAARITLGFTDGSADLSIARLSINRSGSDPFGYETPLLVVSNNNEDNVVTLRAENSNVNGHTAIRLQDYAGAERGAFGLGGDYAGNPFRYTVFREGGNIAGDYGTKDTSLMDGITHSNNPNIPNGFVPRTLVVPSEYDGATDSGGWTRIGVENRGVAVNAIIITRAGRVGIGPSITQSQYPNNNGGSDPAVSSILTVNGSTYIDPDNVAGSMANSTDLVVVRALATGKASIRVGVKDLGSIDLGVAGSGLGAIGVDGAMKMLFKTGITGGNLSTGTERMRLDAGILLVGTTVNTNAANGDIRCDGALWIKDGETAPTNAAGFAAIYVDTADGDLKVKFDDGVTKTLATDT